jgi:hypothetical protein
MPDNAGVYTRTDGTRTGPTVWAQEKAASILVDAPFHDTHDQDIATALNNRVFKDGTTTNVVSLNLTATVNAATGVITIGGIVFANAPNGVANSVFVANAGNYTLTGSNNLGFGSTALASVTSGAGNCAFGVGSLNLATGPIGNNSAFGTGALAKIVSGANNSGFGRNALANCTGSNNCALGESTGGTLTNATHCTVIGEGCDFPSATNTGQLNINCAIFGTGCSSTGNTAGTGLIGINNPAPTYTFDVLTGDIGLGTVGKCIRVNEAANGKQGTAVLVAGSKVVSNTSITANSRILLTSQVDGGAPGFLRVSARSVGISFTITSSSGTDTSTVGYFITEPY